MAACQCTTLARRDRSSFAKRVLAGIEADAAPLYVKVGDVFDPTPDALIVK
jgi:hypothetical protein